MTTQTGVGVSHHRNPKVAAQAAVDQALRAAGCDRPDFVFLFASVGYNQQILVNTVRAATHQAALIGCSGEGIITTGEVDESNFSVAVMVIRSDEMRFEHGMATGLKASAQKVGTEVGTAIQHAMPPDAVSLFLFADGLTFNFDRFMDGLENQLPLDRPLPVFGGAAADNWALQQTYQYCDDQVISDGAVWALLSGEARLAWAANHGCVPIGGKRTVTRCEGNVIYEIDHKPILEVLKEYLTTDEMVDWQKAVINLCLGFKAPGHMQEGYDEFVIRFIPTKDDEQQSITIQTEVTPDTDIWMTRRDHEKIAAGIDQMAASIKAQLGNATPKMVFQFDCCGRGKVVFRDQQKNALLNTLQQQIGATVPWIGLYTLGEIGPVGHHNCFHNYTAVLTAIY